MPNNMAAQYYNGYVQIDLFNQALLFLVFFYRFLRLLMGTYRTPLFIPRFRQEKSKKKKTFKDYPALIHTTVIFCAALIFGFLTHANIA